MVKIGLGTGIWAKLGLGSGICPPPPFRTLGKKLLKWIPLSLLIGLNQTIKSDIMKQNSNLIHKTLFSVEK